jgi:hypothetical protein
MNQHEVALSTELCQVKPGLDIIETIDDYVGLNYVFHGCGAEINLEGSDAAVAVNFFSTLGRNLGLVSAKGIGRGIELAITVAEREEIGIETMDVPYAEADQLLDNMAAEAAATDDCHLF